MSIKTLNIEETLARRVASIYQELMGHCLSTVSCHFLDTRTLAVILDGAITQPEKLLLSSGFGELARVIRQHLNDILKPRLLAEVEAVLQRQVIDSPSDIRFESERMSFLVILAEPSHVENKPLREQMAEV